MTLIRRAMTLWPCSVPGVHSPRINAQFGNAPNWSARFGALVDSGATITLVKLHTVVSIGLDPEEIRQGGGGIPLAGVGGALKQMFRRSLDLRLSNMSQAIILPGAEIYFTDADLPGGVEMLIGQRDALERL